MPSIQEPNWKPIGETWTYDEKYVAGFVDALETVLALPELQDEVIEITDETWSEFAKTAPHPYNELRASIREAIAEMMK